MHRCTIPVFHPPELPATLAAIPSNQHGVGESGAGALGRPEHTFPVELGCDAKKIDAHVIITFTVQFLTEITQ